MKIVDANLYEKIYAENAVLIDVFRATTSIVVMLHKGVKEIIPFENESLARIFIKDHKNYITVGEKDGIKIEEFDYGNSPVELMNADIEGKSVVFVTTNGTRVLKKIEAKNIYFAAFLNADYILDFVNEKTTIVCANRINLFSIEDFMCASYIKAKYEKKSIDFKKIKDIILRSKSAERLRSLNAENDMLFSLNLNTIKIVPIYKDGKIIKLK
ncbi:MAG: 2-phosphosulfolactate phosphatase [Thermoplasmata archaeon]